jgi:uncharacterized damage-inducible protein DinB
MRVNVVGLLRFVHQLRGDFFEAAATLGWKDFARDREVSLGSFRDVFLHLAYVEEHHITQFCEGRPTRWPTFASQTDHRRYRTIDSVRERIRWVTELAEKRLSVWDTERALQKVVCWVRLGHPLRITRENALTQCTTEHLLHLGEVEALLWQSKIEPPTTLWIDRNILQGRPPAPPPIPLMQKIAKDPRNLLSPISRGRPRSQS